MSEAIYWSKIEQAHNEVDIYSGYSAFREAAAKFPEWKIDILAVHWTISEVGNGGLKQFFQNSAGILAPEAVLGFQRIGKSQFAAALQSAMALLGEPYPRVPQARRQRLALSTREEIDESEDEAFSIVPKWVAKELGMDSPQPPFDEINELLCRANDEIEKALDDNAKAKTG
jgi:hypothetical protein